MTSTPIQTGALLDKWSAADRVGIVETDTAVTISRLEGSLVSNLIEAVSSTGWEIEIVDQAGEPLESNHADEILGPFIATIIKNKTEQSCKQILTLSGFRQALEKDSASGIWQVASARMPFATGTISINPWGAGDVFSPSAPTKSPLDIVREAAQERIVPNDIRKWLLRGETTNDLWNDLTFQTFVVESTPFLMRSLSSEVLSNDAILFYGPPRLKIATATAAISQNLHARGYQHLQAAARWVYEDPISTEQRHALFTAEFARSISRDHSVHQAYNEAGHDILEGARLAYQLSQSNLSREAIKAQGDLRKIIADDMAKLAEVTRALSTAIAVAMATGITLIAAKSTGAAEAWLLSMIDCVIAIYLVVVTANGWIYLRLQESLRAQWRQRFYRFIPDEDYNAMVTTPAKKAKRPYYFSAAIALLVSLMFLYAAARTWQEEPLKNTLQHESSIKVR